MTLPPLGISSHFRRAWIRIAAGALIAALTSGCGSRGHHLRADPSRTSHDVQADWDDADAAVEVALHQVEMALDHVEEGSNPALERRYFLWTITEDAAELTLTRTRSDVNGPETIHLEAHVGRFGDPEREAALIRAVRHRLKALAGVSHAPVTEP